MTDLRYPIGTFEYQQSIADEQRSHLIKQIAEAPQHLRNAVEGLSEEQLNTPYRDGGWTVRQVVHHIPDSHMNAYIRFKLAVTEHEPPIKPYAEHLWAQLLDGQTMPIEPSLTLLESLHQRWIVFLRSLTPEDFKKTIHHPDLGIRDLNFLLQLYAWHGRHHVAHVMELRKRKGWK